MDIRLLLEAARGIQSDANGTGVGVPSAANSAAFSPDDRASLFDAMVTNSALRQTCRQLYLDGHFKNAVEEAYKLLNNIVKQKSGYRIDGKALMEQVFRENNPILRFNRLKSQSEIDEQGGYQMIMAGVMRGIRNPRAHEHDLRDDPAAALEMIIWANHLLRACLDYERAVGTIGAWDSDDRIRAT
jgi:uncharacterized protein (TIGR02391 family)